MGELNEFPFHTSLHELLLRFHLQLLPFEQLVFLLLMYQFYLKQLIQLKIIVLRLLHLFNKIPCFAALDKLAKIAGLAEATKAHGDITVNKIIPL